MAEDLIHIGAIRLRVIGSGTLFTTLYSLDSVYSSALANHTLAVTTNIQPTLLANFIQQRISIRCSVNTIDHYFKMRRLVIYAKPVATSVPQ